MRRPRMEVMSKIVIMLQKVRVYYTHGHWQCLSFTASVGTGIPRVFLVAVIYTVQRNQLEP